MYQRFNKLAGANTNVAQRLWLIVLPFIWLFIGFLEVFSASKFMGEFLKGDPLYFVKLDVMWRIIAIFTFFIVYFLVPNRLVKQFVRVSYMVTMVLLLLVLFTSPINGAKRWFSLGPINIHPTELLKFSLLGYLAFMLPKIFRRHSCKSYRLHLYEHVAPVLVSAGLPLLLVLLQPDLSSMGIVLVAVLVVYVYAGRKDKHIKKDIIYGVLLAVILVIVSILVEPYRIWRIRVYLRLLTTGEIVDKFGAGNQIYHILIGIGRGGLLGVGIGQSRQKAGFLVETTAFTDSISAVIFEEFGFLISSVLLMSFVVWFYYLFKAVQSDKLPEDLRLLVIGYVVLLAIQAWVHFGTNVALLPLTGMPLPFISYGGSALVSNMVMLGLIAKVVRGSSGTYSVARVLDYRN